MLDFLAVLFPFFTRMFPSPQYTVKGRYSLQSKTAPRVVKEQSPLDLSRMQDCVLFHPLMTISIGFSFDGELKAIWASLHACTMKVMKVEPLVEIP